jgi:phage shock protein A
MRTMVNSPLAVCLVLVVSHMRANGQSNDPADLQRHVLNAIVELRADLMEYLLDAQDRKVQDLRLELEQVRQGQKRLQDEDRQRVQQIADLEQQVASPELEPPARPQIEALRVQLMTESAEKLRSEHAGLTQREAELVRRLDGETQRARKLHERARQLLAVAGRQ